MTLIEKIIAKHAHKISVSPGEIVDIDIDVRLARDFGGANVVKNLEDNNLSVADYSKTYFTFDCNPTGSDQKYAANQQVCRLFARVHNIHVYDINSGIGTHLAIDQGLITPDGTLVSTDSHANIVGAIGSFGQGMGDRDIASVWANGKVWFRVPESVKIIFNGKRLEQLSAKDIALNLLKIFGTNDLLGYTVELYGEEIEKLSLSERITIASMATEMGATAILIPPSKEIIDYCKARSGKKVEPVYAEPDAIYTSVYELDMTEFTPLVSRPGEPRDAVDVNEVKGIKIDSVFIGSCTNGRVEDMEVVANLLKGKRIAPGIILKIVPSTDEVWNTCLEKGWLKIFKEAGALVGNAGCAGCASGQIGQNGPGEVTVSTGNRNFTGKQGKGDVYLASPEIAIASAMAGYITTPDDIPEKPMVFKKSKQKKQKPRLNKINKKYTDKPITLEGKIWIIDKDNIDTDMIYHNQHLSVTKIEEMGQYTFGNLIGWEDYAQKSEPGDIIIVGKNFGSGSSRQQAVDCFISLGNKAIIAQSFGAIYERNAINAGFPILTYQSIENLELKNRDLVQVNLTDGVIKNMRNGKSSQISKFSEVQMEIYKKGGILS